MPLQVAVWADPGATLAKFAVIVGPGGVTYPAVTALSALIVTLQVTAGTPATLSHPVQLLKLLAGAVNVTAVLLL